jgi:hypothetical protein
MVQDSDAPTVFCTDVAAPVPDCTTDVVKMPSTEPTVPLASILTALEDNSIHFADNIARFKVLLSDPASATRPYIAPIPTRQWLEASAILQSSTYAKFGVAPARTDRAVTINVTDYSGNIAVCVAYIHVTAPVLTPSSTSISMTTLTTSATEIFELDLVNSGDGILTIDSGRVSVFDSTGAPAPWAAVHFQQSRRVVQVGKDNPVAFAIAPARPLHASIQFLGIETPGAGDYNATLRFVTDDPNTPVTEIALRFHVDDFALVIVGLPKTVEATNAPGRVSDHIVAVYNVYSTGLTFAHDGCTCTDAPFPGSALPCRLNSTTLSVGLGACNHSLAIGGSVHVPLQIIAPTAKGLYEYEWRMRPISPLGLPQFWDITAVLVVVPDPAMFDPARTTLALETTPVIATQFFDILTTARDIYGNEITTGGVASFSVNLTSLDGSAQFLSTFDPIRAGYTTANMIASRGGSHIVEMVVTMGEPATMLDSPLLFEVEPLPCTPPETEANEKGNYCMFVFCQRGSGMSTDRRSCQLCPSGTFSDNGNGYGEQCEPCGFGTICNTIGCVSCQTCPAGQRPTEVKTSCVPCLIDAAGTGGVCAQCAIGSAPNTDRTSCDACDAPGQRTNNARSACVMCSAGTEPNVDRTTCVTCVGATYSTVGQCQDCAAPNIVDGAHQTCTACVAGQEPNADRTSCVGCTGIEFSSFGVDCQTCPVDGTAPTPDRAQCEETTADSALTDVGMAVQLLNNTENILLRVSLEFTVTELVMEDGSGDQIVFVQSALETAAAALDIDPSILENGEIMLVGTGRRQLQEDKSVIFSFTIKGPDRTAALVGLQSQLAYPESTLNQAWPVPSHAIPVFGFTCPRGMRRSVGLRDCARCPNGQYLKGDTDCQDCVAALGQQPSVIGDSCECMDGFYNRSNWGGITCYTSDYHAPMKPADECVSSDGLECAASYGLTLDIMAGWSLLYHADGLASVFKCKAAAACPGGRVNDPTRTAGCSVGYQREGGVLCGACSLGYALQSDDTCTECGATSWVTVVVLVLVLLVAIGLIAQVSRWIRLAPVVKEIVDFVRELDLPAVGKVIVSTMQIIGNLSAALRIQFPKVFRETLNMLLAVFRFDITFQLGIGCLADGSYAPSLLGNLAIVFLVVAIVHATYVFETFKVNHQGDDEEKQKEHVREMFQAFDTNDDGITLPEVDAVLVQLDPEASAEVAAKIFAMADVDASGVIDFAEFYSAVTHPEAGEGLDMDLAALVKRTEQNAVRATAVSRLFLLIFLLYPSLTNKIFEAFACRDLGPGLSVLQADYTVDCGSDEYAALFAFCSALVVLWPVGMPVALFVAMFRVRAKIKTGDKDTLETFGFVLGDYDSDHWYCPGCYT